jgi:ABC-type transport system substrate-binding protein
MKSVKKLALSVALIGSLLAGLCVAQPAMSATRDAAPYCPRTITSADSGSTITVVAGTCATLSLNPAFAWSTPVSNSSAVTVTDQETFAPDAIWTLNAVHRGYATITSEGRPICKPGQFCPLFIIEFSVHIRVVPPYGG